MVILILVTQIITVEVDIGQVGIMVVHLEVGSSFAAEPTLVVNFQNLDKLGFVAFVVEVVKVGIQQADLHKLLMDHLGQTLQIDFEIIGYSLS